MTHDWFCKDGEHEPGARPFEGRRRTCKRHCREYAAQSLVTAPAPTETVAAPSPSEVEKIPPEEVTQKVSKSFGKCPTEALSDQRKKTKVSGWHKSCCEGEKSRPHAVEGADGRDFHVIRVSGQLKRAPDAPLEVELTPLTHGMRVWQDGEAFVKYARAMQIPTLAANLYRP
ncbi:hypothetical protein GW17_00042602 [Ensete ventricosum]|nr:hypothetical protein GW17_00042602 [Ensete ventricosum]